MPYIPVHCLARACVPGTADSAPGAAGGEHPPHPAHSHGHLLHRLRGAFPPGPVIVPLSNKIFGGHSFNITIPVTGDFLNAGA